MVKYIKVLITRLLYRKTMDWESFGVVGFDLGPSFKAKRG